MTSTSPRLRRARLSSPRETPNLLSGTLPWKTAKAVAPKRSAREPRAPGARPSDARDAAGAHPALERLAFLLGGGALWALVVRRTLRALQFPFHRHELLVSSIVLAPIAVGALLIVGVESLLSRRHDKKDDDRGVD